MYVCRITYQACKASGSTEFFTLSHKQHDFRRKNLLRKNVCFDFSTQRLTETNLILKRIHTFTHILHYINSDGNNLLYCETIINVTKCTYKNNLHQWTITLTYTAISMQTESHSRINTVNNTTFAIYPVNETLKHVRQFSVSRGVVQRSPV